MQTHWDVVVVGAGPSGMACAASAASFGLNVLTLDEQPMPGGQLYRHVEQQSVAAMKVFGKDYAAGLEFVNHFRASKASYLPEATVWQLGDEGTVCFSRHGVSHEVKAKRVVIATGAMERPVPFSGWTLPGVMSAGGADALCKSSGIVPSGPVVMVGSGPLQLLVAQHLTRAGVEVSHLLDTTPANALVGAFSHVFSALRRPFYLSKGLGMLLSTARTVGNKIAGVTSYSVGGENQVESLTAVCENKEITIPATNVLVHEGIISRTEFSRQLGLMHSWDSVQRYWYPDVDAYGRTSNQNIFMIGDGAYVHGGVAARIKGELAACALAQELGAISRQLSGEKAAPLHAALRKEISPRAFVDAMYSPRPSMYDLADEILVCRCEEVTAGAIRQAIGSGQTTPEMVKAITRCGMGPCQGRMCSIALNEIVATETQVSIEKVNVPTVRPPVRNLPLGELAKMTLLPAANEKESV